MSKRRVVQGSVTIAVGQNGKPSFEESLAKTLASIGIPCFACNTSRMPELLDKAFRGQLKSQMSTNAFLYVRCLPMFVIVASEIA